MATEEKKTTKAAAVPETVTVRTNAETPTLAQVEASTGEKAAPPTVTVTVTDGDETRDVELDASEAAQAAQRAASVRLDTSEGHGATTVGDGSEDAAS